MKIRKDLVRVLKQDCKLDDTQAIDLTLALGAFERMFSDWTREETERVLTESEQQIIAVAEERVTEILAGHGVGVKFDPRVGYGYICLLLPSKRSNHWDGLTWRLL